MKRLGYLALILLLILQSGGILLFYHLQQSAVRYQMQEEIRLKETVFEKLTLSKTEFDKNRINSHEVLLNGKMYDIKSIHYNGSKVTLIALNDKGEENIIRKIKSYLAQSSRRQTIPDHFNKFFSIIYLLPVYDHTSLNSQNEQTFFSYCTAVLLSRTISITSPPPELV